MAADLFVGFSFPDGKIRFHPELDDYPIPFLCGIEFSRNASPMRIPIFEHVIDTSLEAGTYHVCAALIEKDANPNRLANCYWSDLKTFCLETE